jgi:hypothetical protein
MYYPIQIPYVLDKAFAQTATTTNYTDEYKINLPHKTVATKIINEILKTEGYKYDTEKCHYILMGKLITSFNKLIDDIEKIKM